MVFRRPSINNRLSISEIFLNDLKIQLRITCETIYDRLRKKISIPVA